MSKEIAIDVLKDGVKNLKLLLGDSRDTTTHSDMLRGLVALFEAYAMVLNDSTKSHAALAFDKAHKQLFDITQDTKRTDTGPFVWIAGALTTFSAAMTYLYFNRPPATPWKMK